MHGIRVIRRGRRRRRRRSHRNRLLVNIRMCSAAMARRLLALVLGLVATTSATTARMHAAVTHLRRHTRVGSIQQHVVQTSRNVRFAFRFLGLVTLQMRRRRRRSKTKKKKYKEE
jgi:hypothetical protein